MKKRWLSLVTVQIVLLLGFFAYADQEGMFPMNRAPAFTDWPEQPTPVTEPAPDFKPASDIVMPVKVETVPPPVVEAETFPLEEQIVVNKGALEFFATKEPVQEVPPVIASPPPVVEAPPPIIEAPAVVETPIQSIPPVPADTPLLPTQSLFALPPRPAEVWIIGTYMGEDEAGHVFWGCSGSRSTKEEAVSLCRNNNWFVAPLSLQGPLMYGRIWPGAFYPLGDPTRKILGSNKPVLATGTRLSR